MKKIKDKVIDKKQAIGRIAGITGIIRSNAMRDYRNKKSQGLVTIEKRGSNYLIKEKRFDKEYGTEVDNDIEETTIPKLDLQISDIESYLADLNEIKTDANAL